MTHSPRLDWQAALMLLLLATVWGGSFLFGKLALAEVPPLTIVLHRVIWAVPVLAAIVWAKGLMLPTSPRIWGAYLVMGALNNAIPFSLIFWGQTQIDIGLAAILNAMTAMFGAVVAGVCLADERLTFPKLAGAGLGVAGVAVIMGRDVLNAFSLANLAQLAVLGAALSYAFAGVWGRVALAGHPPLVNALGMLIWSTVLMIPVILVVDGPPRLDLSPGIWGSLLALSVSATALAYVLYFAILARAGAANLLLVTLLVPVSAISLGAVVLGEELMPATWIGLGLIALGFAVTDGRVLRQTGQIHSQKPPKAFRVYIESLCRCLSLRSNAKSDAGCFNENSKRCKARRL